VQLGAVRCGAVRCVARGRCVRKVWVCVRAAVVRPRPSPGSHRHHQLAKASGRIRGIKNFGVIGDLEAGLLKSFLKSGLSFYRGDEEE
jgi:hypothetical protein